MQNFRESPHIYKKNMLNVMEYMPENFHCCWIFLLQASFENTVKT